MCAFTCFGWYITIFRRQLTTCASTNIRKTSKLKNKQIADKKREGGKKKTSPGLPGAAIYPTFRW
jgi:hypothetical protein